MNPTTTPPADGYVYGRTLGRRLHRECARDRLPRVLQQLDGLLCVVSDPDVDEGGEGKHYNAFQRFNPDIQRATLMLASELAEEAHELWTEITCARESQQ